MVGQDEHAVRRGHRVPGRLDGRELVAVEGELGDEGIRIRDLAAAPGEQLDDLEGGRLPDVVDVGLVRHAEHENGGAPDGATPILRQAKASSLARAMLTLRKVFSRSLAVSATRGLEASNTLTVTCR